MRKFSRCAFAIALIVLIAGLFAAPAFAQTLDELIDNKPAAPNFNVIHVDDLVQLMHDPSAHLYIYDVNPVDDRAQTGSIPGAELLPNYIYDTSAVLPPRQDATLVFYCRNLACKASDIAANRALLAGYTDVDVMVDGIEGWIKAGRRTEQ